MQLKCEALVCSTLLITIPKVSVFVTYLFNLMIMALNPLTRFVFTTVAMSARLVQHLSCLLILSQKVKELHPNLEVANANLQLYSDKVEKPVLRML